MTFNLLDTMKYSLKVIIDIFQTFIISKKLCLIVNGEKKTEIKQL